MTDWYTPPTPEPGRHSDLPPDVPYPPPRFYAIHIAETHPGYEDHKDTAALYDSEFDRIHASPHTHPLTDLVATAQLLNEDRDTEDIDTSHWQPATPVIAGFRLLQ